MFLPFFLKTQGIRFLIVGAGNIALAKLETILEFSSNVVILSPQISLTIRDIAHQKNLKIIEDEYNIKYLHLFDVIISATNNKELNNIIANDSKSLNKLINVVDNIDKSDFIFGSIIKRNNLVVAVSSFGISPVLARIIKQKINLSLYYNLDLITDFIRKNRQLVKEKLNNIQFRRLFWQNLIEGSVGVELASGNLQKAQILLNNSLDNADNKSKSVVYFIGAGPGDPELITLKAINLLSKADIVLYDRLVSLQILNHARKDAIKINVGKTRDIHTYTQNEINLLIEKYAKEGNIVARLKGGDPALFGHLSEEIDTVVNLNIPFQIVPGITAASGASAYSGIPLTSRNSNKSLRFLTLYHDNLYNKKYWKELALTNDTLVFYMSSHNLPIIAKNLIKYGKKNNISLAVIEQATTKFQKTYIYKLGDFEKDLINKKFISPSLIIIGEIVEQHSKYNWKEEIFDGVYFSELSQQKFHSKPSKIKEYPVKKYLQNNFQRIVKNNFLQVNSITKLIKKNYENK